MIDGHLKNTAVTETELQRLIDRAREGDQQALASLFTRYRAKLRRMIALRLDQRLNGRVDPSDILQEAFIDLAGKLKNFDRKGDLPFFVWLRLVTGERLLQVHRRHLATRARDARMEASLPGKSFPDASSVLLAEQLVGSLSSASGKAMKLETHAQLQRSLSEMDETDREVIALRHFEELSNIEVAHILGLSPTAASNRYIRAIRRLKESMNSQSSASEV